MIWEEERWIWLREEWILSSNLNQRGQQGSFTWWYGQAVRRCEQVVGSPKRALGQGKGKARQARQGCGGHTVTYLKGNNVTWHYHVVVVWKPSREKLGQWGLPCWLRVANWGNKSAGPSQIKCHQNGCWSIRRNAERTCLHCHWE